MTPIFFLIAILLCLILSAFFSGSEVALLRLRPEQLDADIKTKPRPGTVAARDLIKSSSRLLVTILLGNNVVNIFAAVCASSLAIHYLGEEMGVLVATIVMTILVLVFSEILPKAIAAKDPQSASYFVSLPLYIIHKILFPIHLIFDRIIDPVVKKIVGKSEMDDLLSSESLLRMAKNIRHQKLDGSPIPIIGAAAKAAELRAADIMTAKSEIVAFPVEISSKELYEKMLKERFTRVPIFEGSLDKVLGLVHLKDLAKLIQNNASDLKSILKPILRVPERKPILDILRDMQKESMHMAIVKDEFGITHGLLTQEDILEEIVGEIRDEFDQCELSEICKVSKNQYEVLGPVLVHDFERQTGWEIKSEKGDTLGGLVFNLLGRTPKLGDKVVLNDFEIYVKELSGNRIDRVLVKRLN